MADSVCLFDVIEDIPTLHDAFKKNGLITAQDLGPCTSAKQFAIVKCVANNPARAEGSAKELGRNRGKCPGHCCQEEATARYLTAEDKHQYEVVIATRPARLFLDLDWIEGEIDCLEDNVVDRVLDLLYGYCDQHYKFFSKNVVLECSRSNTSKRSFHVIFPDGVFRQIDGDMKVFVLGFARWIVDEKDGAGLSYVKTLKNGKRQIRTVIDTAVYTKNRNFRMLNQSKWIDKTGAQMRWRGGAKPDWAKVSDTLVQPMNVSTKDEILTAIDDIISCRAPTDGMYPLYPEKGSIGWRIKKTSFAKTGRPLTKSDMKLFPDERRSMAKWLTSNKKQSPDKTMMINETSKHLYRSAKPQCLAIYDPQQPNGIYTRLEEFETFDQLKNDIIKSAYDAPRKRAIIYTSSSDTAKRIINMIFSQVGSPTKTYL